MPTPAETLTMRPWMKTKRRRSGTKANNKENARSSRRQFASGKANPDFGSE